MKLKYSIIAMLILLFILELSLPLSKNTLKTYLQTQFYTYTCDKTECSVYLSSTIGEESYYLDLYSLIVSAPENQIINIHLSGSGGIMSTVYHLANVILQSKAKVNMIVEGPVYSAHAFIATLGNKLTIYPSSTFLFHLPAIAAPGQDAVIEGQDCGSYLGHKDRGQDAVPKCLALRQSEQDLFDSLFTKHIKPYLTAEEIDRLYKGYDIIISGKDLQKRIDKLRLQ